ncbi:acyl-CoA thioesterase [Calorimonas adulescens]|uniref:Acyl-CoA thioesterase n=1 Tax=Calorimonas adulescens TaxID=2606906 RepID=A0A5D8QFY7_9THEO|nr:thioesterase family protein [Calorimonas adulescens]TZE83139.1 acyl-CoA thioesterase [Calorimonas adulescens]
MLISESKIRVRYEETDQMGVVYYSNYYRYFEVGRTDWFRNLGISYKKLEEMGIFLPVVESHCRYYHSIFYDDVITVKTIVTEFTGVRIRFDYAIYRDEENEKLAEGYTLLAVTNGSIPVNLKKYNRMVYDLIKNSL